MAYEAYFIPSTTKFSYNAVLEVFEAKDENSEHDSWVFVFLDLVYVALLSKLTAAFQQCALDIHTFQLVTALFLIAFTSRLSLDDYCNRFYANDVYHRMGFFLYTAGMYGLAINISVNMTEDSGLSINACGLTVDSSGFLVGFLLTRLSLCLFLTPVICMDKWAKQQFSGTIYKNVLAMVLVLLLYFLYSARSVSIYLIFVVVEVSFAGISMTVLYLDQLDVFSTHIFPLIGSKWTLFGFQLNLEELFSVESHYPFDIYTHQSRLASFVMMVLGEAIITVILPQYKTAVKTAFFAFCSLCVTFSYALSYFDTVIREKGKGQHAMSRSLLSSFLFTWMHAPLGLFMYFTSASLGLIYSRLDFIALPANTLLGETTLELHDMHVNRLLAYCVATVITLMEVMRTLHYGFQNVLAKRRKLWGKLTKALFVVFHILLPVFTTSPLLNVFLHALVLVFMNVVDIVTALEHKRLNKSKVDTPSSDSSDEPSVEEATAPSRVTVGRESFSTIRTTTSRGTRARDETVDFGISPSLANSFRRATGLTSIQNSSEEGEGEEERSTNVASTKNFRDEVGNKDLINCDAAFITSLAIKKRKTVLLALRNKTSSFDVSAVVDSPWVVPALSSSEEENQTPRDREGVTKSEIQLNPIVQGGYLSSRESSHREVIDEIPRWG